MVVEHEVLTLIDSDGIAGGFLVQIGNSRRLVEDLGAGRASPDSSVNGVGYFMGSATTQSCRELTIEPLYSVDSTCKPIRCPTGRLGGDR
jgi:hypothetical protein